MTDFILKKNLSELDPEVKKIIDLEEERQNRKLIFIPSESSAPNAVRESLGSVLQNIYAEGYPREETRFFSEEEILDFKNQITHFHRYSDPRYYKGVEFADVLEELARRRCAELFANDIRNADEIFVNVQPLSGAPANNAVYQALIEPGDVVLSMNLFHGGHLTHGASVNRSGKLYNVFHYCVDPDTEKINYEKLSVLAEECKPKIIIAGYSSYPWVPDWKRFRKIADLVGAYLFADVSHIAGLIAGKTIPSPIGFADVITFTTHKTLCGPRGACILSFDERISRKIDHAVFPGEQGGPHVQVFAAMATIFKLAKSKNFSDFQKQIVINCTALSNQLQKRDLRIAYGGSDTHLTNIDCKSIIGADGTALSGDMAARVLDLAGMVTNANTIPGDKSAFRASSVRLGTPWLTQRGLIKKDMVIIADIIADILHALIPYSIRSGNKTDTRAKIDFRTLENAKLQVREIAQKAMDSVVYEKSGYPFFHFMDEFQSTDKNELVVFLCSGTKITQSLNYIFPANIEMFKKGKIVETNIYIENIAYPCFIQKNSGEKYYFGIKAEYAGLAAEWLRGLSDGFIQFDKDLYKRIPGPFIVEKSRKVIDTTKAAENRGNFKPYYIGISSEEQGNQKTLPEFIFSDNTKSLKRTPLFEWHKNNGAKIIPFAGWEMPVWYSSVLEEHQATRNSAGLFDVMHMGVFQVEGNTAVSFLNSVCANDIGALDVGQSCYTHLLNPDANVIDDLLVYMHEPEKYMMVVNAANEMKDWAWLNAVIASSVKIDNQKPYAHAFGTDCQLINLKNPSAKEKLRVDIAIQGPKSRIILEKIGLEDKGIKQIRNLKRTELCHIDWGGSDLIVSRTGYTGEKMAFEIFVHPDSAERLWKNLIKAGTPLGMKPCGLGARDSLRTEAGLPLYGHELGGIMNLGVSDAGFGVYVKTYKPWFIGRESFLLKEEIRDSTVVRFRFEEKNVRLAHLGDPVLNEKGKVIGTVTSCAIDRDSFLTGQAYILNSYTGEGISLYIYQGSSNINSLEIKSISKGDRLPLPAKATVISRFTK